MYTHIMYIYIYIVIHVYMYIYIYIYTSCIYIYIYIYIYMYTHICCLHTRISLRTRMHTCRRRSLPGTANNKNIITCILSCIVNVH